ncbi:DoxX family protein [Bacillus sp. NPDC077027]|uniref:DoxX family protein n=1 Tax=Bacillus sp. NPDC077027 TaxID=3390548 RepID=UPI003D063C94
MKMIIHRVSTYLFAFLFFGAGIFHLMELDGFARMLYALPFPYFIVYATAFIEWGIAVLLLIPRARRQTAKWTAIYLVLIFPANLFATKEGIPFPGQEHTDSSFLWGRLIVHPLLILWAMSIVTGQEKSIK